MKMKSQAVIKCVLVLIGVILCIEAETIKEDKHTLLHFVSNISHSHSLNWSPTLSICTKWNGVTCDSNHSSVVGLHLAATGLHGHLQLRDIARLTNLQFLILSSNNISGPFPPSFQDLKNLTELRLDFNEFSGPLPSDFSSWERLRVLDLSNNRFDGSIPSSIKKLALLHSLNLANNKFSGEIPNLHVPGLKLLNLARNNLTGTVPESLQRFPLSAFFGNNISSAPVHSSLRKHHHNHAVLGVSLSACFATLALLAILLVIIHNREEQRRSTKEKPRKRRNDSDPTLGGEGGNKIVFFEGKNLVFDLEDLLRASAEVLGKGPFGTTYKVDVEDSATIVVKRIKEVCVPQREFEQQIEQLGQIKHENVATVRGYFYSKDEKLVVYDYYEHGSLSTLLHGQRCLPNRKPLDWETRLNMVYGAAKGVAHIHSQSLGSKLVHGNIKSSNVFLNAKGYGCVSGAGMATLMHSLPRHASSYRAPEITDTRKGTQQSDVYSFGVLIFEVLTGKAEVGNLVRWVNSVVREEWTGEVFDEELMRCTQVEEEMVEMLQVGMVCTGRLPEKRPSMSEVVRMVEEIRPEKLASGYRSEVSTGSTPIGSLSGSPYIL
ncbi:inactive receptor kinase [Hirschfeldia incana]|nr:inactive receptor kinase [Hirschfeldia incana]